MDSDNSNQDGKKVFYPYGTWMAEAAVSANSRGFVSREVDTRPLSPDDLSYPTNLIAKINDALRKSYSPFIGSVTLDWYLVVRRSYTPELFLGIAKIYEQAGWKVTFCPRTVQERDAICFERVKKE